MRKHSPGFIPDIKVQPPIIIEIGPDSRLRRSKRKQTAFDRDIRKGAVAIVAQ